MPEDRDDFFYIPGRILHIDGDNEYLKRCLKFYKNAGLTAFGVYEKEENLYKMHIIQRKVRITHTKIVIILQKQLELQEIMKNHMIN